MNRTVLALGASTLLLALAGCSTATSVESEAGPTTSAAADKPNIVMILLDDLGYSDLGSYGGEAETPNIDALTEESAQFTDFYATPLCAPTRAALLTGQDPHRVGLGSMEGLAPPGVSQTTPGYKGSLEGEFTSIASVLQDTGYDTYQVGKWHLGGEEGQRPQDLGFDQNFTLYDAGASYYADSLRHFNRPKPPVDTAIHERNGDKLDSASEALPDDFFATRSYTDEMIDMIDQSVESDSPFFSYLAYTAPHDPLHVEDKALIDKYLDLYLDDYNFEALREERIHRMEERGLLPKDIATRWPEQTPEWDSLTPEQQYDLAYRMAVYSAVLDETDAQVGRVIDHLKETGEYDNTLIAVVSDNGSSASTLNMYQTIGKDDTWHERVYPKIGDTDFYGHQGSFPSIGLPNAQVSSGPYFQAKNTLFEGGIRVPAIIKSPAGGAVESQHELVDTFAHITDLYPTFADYAGADVTEVPNLLGDSIKPVLDGSTKDIGDDDFGWEHFGHRAFRSGDWKLIFAPTPMGGSGDYALYNIADDPGETKDLATEHPEIVMELSEKWDGYAEANGVVPVDFARVNDESPAMAENWFAIDWATAGTLPEDWGDE